MRKPLEITVPFESSYGFVDQMKYLALYFDKVHVRCPVIEMNGQRTAFYSDTIFSHIMPLIHEGIVTTEESYVKKDLAIHLIKSSTGHAITEIGRAVSDYYKIRYDSLDSGDSEVLSSLLYYPPNRDNSIMDFLVSCEPEEIFPDSYFNGMIPIQLSMMIPWLFYGLESVFMLSEAIRSFGVGQRASCPPTLIDGYKNTVKSKCSIGLTTAATVEAAGILLPNMKNLPIDEVLEKRYKCRDELEEMRNYIAGLLGEKNTDTSEDLSEYVSRKINSDIKDFNLKMQEGRLNLIQKIIEDLQNPLPTALLLTPLFSTFFGNVPAYLTATASLGLIAAKELTEYEKYHVELKREALYFRLGLQR